MFVEIVIAPLCPAKATISASRAWFLAFNNSNFNPLLRSKAANSSESSTEAVPTKTGCPFV
ncbi:MAG: hypothetical protein MJ195_02295 [Mycoplasmoidaceae bacterium]|nr:hypothetical protein [Mycoplasmoidaceae bacterium]